MIRRPPGPPDAAVPERGTFRDFRFPWKRGADQDALANLPPSRGVVMFHSSIDQNFVRRSLRPVPRSRFEALTERAGDVFLCLCALVVLLGFLSRC